MTTHLRPLTGSDIGVLEEAPRPPPPSGEAPLFGVAMLKIALQLKREPARPLDALIREVLTRMKLDETAFRAFLDTNGGLLKLVARAHDNPTGTRGR